jgi:thiol-disulfide isomerase/thioredoxin
MKKWFLVFGLCLFIWQPLRLQELSLTKIHIINFDQFEPYLHFRNDTIYLINFWATWCAPCREEFPSILRISQKYGNKKFKVILVSLDLPNQVESHLLPYLRSKNVTSDVILLDDPNSNRWIDKVSPNWSGGLPFSLIYGRNFREPYEQSFTFNKLDSIINLKLKNL